MLRKRKQVVGLYIGSRKIAVSEAQIDSSGALEVEHLGITDTPPDAVRDGRVVDKDAVARTIRGLLSANDIKNEDVSLVIPAGSNVITRLLTLPSMPKKEMTEALRTEVENYAVLSTDEPVLDFQVLDQKVEGVAQKTEILLVAVPRGLINSYIQAVESANLNLVAIETVPMAVLRAMEGMLKHEDERNNTGEEKENYQPVMLVGIEEDGGTVTIASDGIVKFIHGFDIGRQQLEDGSAIMELADELSSSQSYYETTFPQDKEIGDIILFADGIDIVKVRGQLEEHLYGSISEPNIPEKASESIKSKIADQSLSAYASIGSAIHATSGKSEDIINLIPIQKREAPTTKKQKILLVLPVFIMLLLFAGTSFVLKMMTNSIENKLNYLQRNQGNIDSEALKEITEIESIAQKLKTQADITETAISSIKRTNWAKILREVSEMIPKSVWLNSFRWLDNKDASFNGIALSYDSVFRFRETLEASGSFGSVKLISIRSTTVADRPVFQFEIICQVRRETLERKENTADANTGETG